MTDRDRLIEIIINADTYDSYDCKLCAKGDDACDCCFAEKIADHLLANGVIVLPCEKGAVLNRNGEKCIANHWNIILTAFNENNQVRLFDIKEAEAELRKRGVSNAENN